MKRYVKSNDDVFDKIHKYEEMINSLKPGDLIQYDSNHIGVTPKLSYATIVEPAGRIAGKGDPNGTKRFKVKLMDGRIITIDDYAIRKKL